MHRTYNRRTAMRVKHGKVKRSSRHQLTGLRGYTLDRRSPIRGYRHVVTKRDVQGFIDLIPEWDDLSRRLERIVLASSNDSDGEYVFYYSDELSAIYLYAWPADLWMELDVHYFEEHRELLEVLGVTSESPADGTVSCRFTLDQARAYMLLHVFLHELGHHHDRLRQTDREAKSGEEYAERFANERFREIYPHYCRVFGDPAIER